MPCIIVSTSASTTQPAAEQYGARSHQVGAGRATTAEDHQHGRDQRGRQQPADLVTEFAGDQSHPPWRLAAEAAEPDLRRIELAARIRPDGRRWRRERGLVVAEHARKAVVAQHQIHEVVVRRTSQVRPAPTRATPASAPRTSRPTRRRPRPRPAGEASAAVSRYRRRQQVCGAQRRHHHHALEHLGQERQPHRGAGQRQPPGPAAVQRADGAVRRGRHQTTPSPRRGC